MKLGNASQLGFGPTSLPLEPSTQPAQRGIGTKVRDGSRPARDAKSGPSAEATQLARTFVDDFASRLREEVSFGLPGAEALAVIGTVFPSAEELARELAQLVAGAPGSEVQGLLSALGDRLRSFSESIGSAERSPHAKGYTDHTQDRAFTITQAVGLVRESRVSSADAAPKTETSKLQMTAFIAGQERATVDGLYRSGDEISGSPTPRSPAARIKTAGLRARGMEGLSDARIECFNQQVLPELAGAVASHFGVSASKLAAQFNQVSLDVQRDGKTKEGTPDTSYPPRAAFTVFNAPGFQELFGLSKDGVSEAVAFTTRIADLELAPNSRCPSLDQLSSEDARTLERVTSSLQSGTPSFSSLSEGEKAISVLMFTNNTTWHVTNFQRAADDPTRADPSRRNALYNTYPASLALQKDDKSAQEMLLMDAYQYGKSS